MAKMGGARTFFTVYASIKSEQILDDANALGAVLTAVFTDAVEGMMIAFEEVFMGIQQWNDALMDLAEPIEMATIHFEKFFDEVSPEVKQLEQDIMSIGAAYNQSAAESLEAAATMAQLGNVIGGQPAQGAAREGAMLLGAVGMMETEAAMSALTQLQLQTNYMYNGLTRAQKELLTEEEQRAFVLSNTIGLVDKLNEVENKSGATIQNLIGAMNQYASAATIVNTSLDEQIALGATLIEQGEQSSKAGRGIKQMLARLASDRSQNNALLAEYGVAVKDSNGNMFTLMDVMDQLKPKWDDMNSSQQTNIAIGVAGAHHYVRFIKLMEGYDRAVEIMADSQNSMNSALLEYEVFQKNAMYQTQQYEKEIDLLNYAIAEKLIPSTLRATQVNYMFAQARLLISEGPLFEEANTWAMIASATFEAMKGVMAFSLAIVTVGVAQKTLLAQAVERTRLQQIAASYSQVEAEAYKGKVQAETLLIKLRNDGLLQHLNENQLQKLRISAYGEETLANAHKTNTLIHHNQLRASELAILEQGVMVTQFRNLEHRASTTLGQQTISQQFKILEMDGMSLTQSKAKLTLLREQERTILHMIAEKETELLVDKTLTETQRAALQVRLQTLQVEQTLNAESIRLAQARIMLMDNELIKTYAIGRSKQEYIKMTTVKQRLDISELIGNYALAASQEGANLSLLKGIDIKILDAALRQAVIKGTMTEARANQLLAGAIGNVNNMKMVGMRIAMGWTNAMMLASMGVMFFAKGADAAEASAMLMTLAFVPMIAMTVSATGAMTALGTKMAFATLGLSVFLGALALAVAKEHDLFGSVGTDMEAQMEQVRKDSEEVERMLAEHEARTEAWMTTGMLGADGMAESIDNATESIAKFDDKRLEVFFGGRRSAMDAAMFQELKQNGVENLYFAPEVSVVNNFHGLTMDEATDQIGERIADSLKTSGVYQRLA